MTDLSAKTQELADELFEKAREKIVYLHIKRDDVSVYCGNMLKGRDVMLLPCNYGV